MWFKRLIVKNIRTLRDVDLTLKRGLIGVFGRNGAGKSTVLDLMYSLLTNDFTRFDGVKTDQISNTAGPKDEAFVYGEVEHDGHLIRLHRGLRPAKHNLQIDNEEPITNADKIAERLEEVLGVDAKLLDLFVFKRQDAIYDFISSTDAERKKAFQALCQTEFCEELWNVIGDVLSKDAELNTEIVDNSDELAGKIAEFENEIQSLEQEKKQWGAQLLTAASQATADEILKKQQRLEDLVEERDTEQGRLPELETEATEAERVRKARAGKLAQLKESYPKVKKAAQDAAAALKAWSAYEKHQQREETLESERKALVLEEKKNPIPEKPKDFDTTDLTKLNKELVRMEQDLERRQETLKVFEGESVVACPTCSTPVHELEAHLAECKKLVASYPAKIKALEDMVERMDNYKSQAAKYSKWQAGWSARMKANQEARDALKDLEEPDGPKEALEAAVAALETADTEIEETQERLNKAIKRVATATSAVDACKRRLAEIGQGITENTVDSEKVAKVKKRLAEHTEAQKKIANIEGQISGKQDQIEEAKEDVKKLKAKLKRSKRVRKMVKILGRARDVLHRDCLPNRVAQINLGRMEGDVNEGLGYFGNPFWVESDANLQFLVHKPGEPAQRAGQLSTGLRVVLAIPFWLAVASLWKNEIGMLALDEPTANLDEDNRAFLAEALSALTVKMKGSRQIIMVTHADNLKASFDQVIDVG